MSENKPHVVMVVVDALRWDVLDWAIKNDMAPNLKELEKWGDFKDNHFTSGSPTQFSFSSMVSSRNPLDDTGYEKGVVDRPIVLAELMRKNGYKTMGSTACTDLTPYHGYDRGFDEYHYNCDPTGFSSTYAVEVDRVLDLNKESRLEEEDAQAILEEKTERFLEASHRYIRAAREKEGSLHVSGGVQYREMNAFEEKITSYEKNIKNEGFCVDLARSFARDLKDLPHTKNLKNAPNSYKLLWIKKTIRHLLGVLPYSNPKRALKSFLIYIRNAASLHDKGAARPGNFITDQFLGRAEKLCSSEAGFFFLHYYDVHEKRIYPKNMTLNDLRKLKCKNMPHFLLLNPGYLAGLINFDYEIGRFFSALKSMSRDRETKLLLTSDHGATGETPVSYLPERRYKGFSVANTYFDEIYKVPLYLGSSGSRKPSLGDCLTSSIDIVPTICHELGLSTTLEMKGLPIQLTSGCKKDSQNKKNYVLAENMGRGSAIFGSKDIYLMVRDRSTKVVCKFGQSDSMSNYAISEAYFLDEDPYEENNIGIDAGKLYRTRKLAARACQRMREINKNKILKEPI